MADEIKTVEESDKNVLLENVASFMTKSLNTLVSGLKKTVVKNRFKSLLYFLLGGYVGYWLLRKLWNKFV